MMRKSSNVLESNVLPQYIVLLGMGPKPKSFTYAELRSATKDFDPSNKLGEGGFGPVDKVTMSYIYKLTYRYRELQL
ncbi:hypothetical protein Patl1_11734 [Pistacia atlantica]|uniref:Uncharacterized protein n=1 Tax=Pistacia atlantica TaxID=434234 RepID=A0ACC1A569_9ROSI|nr:hypothetical protein Patl1_11734 [Pistacia atlantica]